MATINENQPSFVEQLRDQYSQLEGLTNTYAGNVNHLQATNGNIESDGFIGGENVIFLCAGRKIEITSPGCLASKYINMVANEAIELGLSERSLDLPVRIYSTNAITITTKHLSIGNLEIQIAPMAGKLYCEKLTLHKRGDEEPEAFEIVKSWAMNNQMEIETIESNEPSVTDASSEPNVEETLNLDERLNLS